MLVENLLYYICFSAPQSSICHETGTDSTRASLYAAFTFLRFTSKYDCNDSDRL